MKNSEIIKDNFVDYCTGCGACKNVCPVGAITINENKDGFLYPVIDETKCINCGKCKLTCPTNNNLVSNNINPKCYAVWANDEIRLKCSSGGVFGAIAQKFLEGISTSKLHAYGPMGVQELTTTKFVVFGEGQVRK